MIAGRTWWWPDASDAEVAREQIQQCMAAMSGGEAENRKQGRRKGLFALRLPEQGREPTGFNYLLKENRYAGATALRRRWKGSKARTELERAERLCRRGLDTPVPVAAGEKRTGRGVTECWLLVPILPGVVDLRAHWNAGPPPAAERRALATKLGVLAGAARDAGLFQDDFAPNNVLIRPGVSPQLTMIDFERGAVRDEVSEPELLRMLSKLEREMVGANQTDRMRFLHAFDRNRARWWWEQLCQEAAKLMARDLAHLTRTLRKPGRRFEPAQEGTWRGWIRLDAKPHELHPPTAEELASGALRRLGPLADPACRQTMALAILLARRGLGPTPVALWRDSNGAHLRWETDAGNEAMWRSPRSGARNALLRRVLGVGSPMGPLTVDHVVAELPGAPGRTLWIAPEALRVTGRPTPATLVQQWLSAGH